MSVGYEQACFLSAAERRYTGNMNALETSFASCRSWQDSTTQEWSSSLPSEDYTFCVGAAHDTGEALTTLTGVHCFPRRDAGLD